MELEREVTAPTISALLADRARRHGAKSAYTFLDDGQTESASLTYEQLDRHARAIAARIQERARPGDRALVLTVDNVHFVRAFMACQHAGVIAVPVAPPLPIGSRRRVDTLRAIVRDCAATLVLTGGSVDLRTRVGDVAPELAALPWLAVDTVPSADAEAFRQPPVAGDDVSFLQYTSGSTSTPKGVMVSHRNLMLNEKLFARCMGLGPEDVLVSWLPLFHDLGLIGNVLQNLYLGAHAVLMPPLAFVQRPARWLRALTRYRGTMGAAPNFAYELCVRRIPEAERGEFDLSSWRLALNGAEPVRAATLEAFAEAYAPYGFDRDVLYPAYGLAEVTLLATGSVRGQGAITLAVERDALREGKVVTGGNQVLVGVGKPRIHREVEIVDPDSCQALRPDTVGEVWLAGPDIALGYWQRPQESEATFRARLADSGRGPFLRTGDLGVVHEGELYITGRLKDLIILGGCNYYPSDIEASAEAAHDWIRSGCSAAFPAERDGGEELVLVAEVLKPAAARRPGAGGTPPGPGEIERRIRAAISADHGIQVAEVVLAVPGSVPKTSSGKLQRRACRAAYEQGTLRRVPGTGTPLSGEGR